MSRTSWVTSKPLAVFASLMGLDLTGKWTIFAHAPTLSRLIAGGSFKVTLMGIVTSTSTNRTLGLHGSSRLASNSAITLIRLPLKHATTGDGGWIGRFWMFSASCIQMGSLLSFAAKGAPVQSASYYFWWTNWEYVIHIRLLVVFFNCKK